MRKGGSDTGSDYRTDHTHPHPHHGYYNQSCGGYYLPFVRTFLCCRMMCERLGGMVC